MKLALIQMSVVPGEVERNLSCAAEWVGKAAALGAEVVLLPEALPFGWMDPSARAAEAIPEGGHFRGFATLAKQHGIYLCTGVVERSENITYNSAVLISPSGELLLHHRKIHELDIAHDCYALGDRLAVADTTFGRVGLMICADGFAPGQAITRTLGLMGAQVILSPCAWAVPPAHDNQRTPYGKLWTDNYSAPARDFNMWIAGCSNVGPIKNGPWAGHNCIGCSLVVAPTGEVAYKANYGFAAEEVVLVEILPVKHSRYSAA